MEILFFTSNIERFKGRAVCILGSGKNESSDPNDRFSLEHAYIIKGILNLKRSLRNIFNLGGLYEKEKVWEWLGMVVIGRIDVKKEIDEILVMLANTKDETKKEEIKEKVLKIKEAFPEFEDKIKIIE